MIVTCCGPFVQFQFAICFNFLLKISLFHYVILPALDISVNWSWSWSFCWLAPFFLQIIICFPRPHSVVWGWYCLEALGRLPVLMSGSESGSGWFHFACQTVVFGVLCPDCIFSSEQFLHVFVSRFHKSNYLVEKSHVLWHSCNFFLALLPGTPRLRILRVAVGALAVFIFDQEHFFLQLFCKFLIF